MNPESANLTITAKLPVLKLGEYESWRFRIEQYIQCIDYALWDVIKNGNSFKLKVQTTEADARSTLLMALPNEHQLKFNQFLNAKTLLAAIEKRLQKLVSQLELVGVNFEQEDVNQNTNEGVNTASTQVSTADINNLSDAVIYAFLASKSNSPQLLHEDLEQIHEDDLEEMDLKWQLAMLTVRARMFLKNTGRKLTIRLQGIKTRGTGKAQESTVVVETSTDNALVSCDGLGAYNWSDQAEEGPNYALMAYSSSSSDFEVSNVSTCSKSCLKSVETLKSQLEQLRKDLDKSELMAASYKVGLASVKEKLIFYRDNEIIFYDDIAILKRDILIKDSEIGQLKREIESVKKEKNSIKLNVEKFKNASKSLDKLIECQITDKSKKGLGYGSYNAVSPPHTGRFVPLKLDLSYTGLEEFVSDNEDEIIAQPKEEKKIVKPNVAKVEFVKPKQQEKNVRKSVRYAEQYRQNTHSPRGNQRNWNNKMSQNLGSNFVMFNKACYVCGSFDHLQVDCDYHKKQFSNHRMVRPVWNNSRRVNQPSFAKRTHPCVQKTMVPRAVLMKSGLKSLNTTRPVNTTNPKSKINSARPMSYFLKSAHLFVKRPINKETTLNNSNFKQGVNTVKGKTINTAKLNATVLNAVKGKKVNAVKASACWVWKPKQTASDQGNPQKELEDRGVIDSGCSRLMTRNMSYLTDFKEIDRGYW
ncbi:hypothetical protein Tco_0516298 [Tanacetum coccineum]